MVTGREFEGFQLCATGQRAACSLLGEYPTHEGLWGPDFFAWIDHHRPTLLWLEGLPRVSPVGTPTPACTGREPSSLGKLQREASGMVGPLLQSMGNKYTRKVFRWCEGTRWSDQIYSYQSRFSAF